MQQPIYLQKSGNEIGPVLGKVVSGYLSYHLYQLIKHLTKSGIKSGTKPHNHMNGVSWYLIKGHLEYYLVCTELPLSFPQRGSQVSPP